MYPSRIVSAQAYRSPLVPPCTGHYAELNIQVDAGACLWDIRAPKRGGREMARVNVLHRLDKQSSPAPVQRRLDAYAERLRAIEERPGGKSMRGLIYHRRASLLTQVDVARLAGLSQSTYQRIEAGTVSPDLDTLYILMAMFETDLSGLM